MEQLFNTVAQIKNCPQGAADDKTCFTNLPQVSADSSTLATGLSIVFGVISAVTVLIIIIQALRFVISQGEPEKAAKARKAIIYAFIGLGISLSANLIVIFILKDVLA